jgi:hypothetical protein
MDLVERSYSKKSGSRNSTAVATRGAPSFQAGGLWYKERHCRPRARARSAGAKNTNGAT